jgi:hypothetical protein
MQKSPRSIGRRFLHPKRIAARIDLLRDEMGRMQRDPAQAAYSLAAMRS